MRKYTTTVIVMMILAAISVSAQNFEGKISYNLKFTSNSPDMTADQLTSMIGDKMEYYIKGGNLKVVMNGTYIQWQVYNNKDNRRYDKYLKSDTIYWTDCSVINDSTTGIELNKGVTEVLGYKCDELVVNSEKGVRKYYFNSALGIDPKLFEKDKYDGWYDFVNQAKALPMKFSFDLDGVVITGTATEVNKTKLDDKIFELPAKVPVTQKIN